MRRRLLFTSVAAALVLTACAAPEETTPVAATGASAGPKLNTSADQQRILPAKDDAAAALLPADVAASGKLIIGVGAAGAGFPPLAFAADDNKTLIGSEPDVAAAIASTLGLEPVLENTSWENLFIGLDSGKFQLGASNITVTEERKLKYDFVTYRLDNLAWLAKKGSGLTITKAADIAGKKVAVGSGTNQEKILVEWAEEVKAAGLPEVEIKYYQTNQATFLALGSGQIDLYLGPSPAAAYQVATVGDAEIVGTYSGAGKDLQGLIALTTKKDNGLVKAYAAALDKLIASGDYGKILDRWNLANEAVQKAEVNPPGLPIEGK
ncbi:ABC transporter substrate-binding protein [Actinoplanes couchii]|uniref:Amino acid ABC transporter, substrate-binding protein n=1 Tax=Actinoplanes couchii TaxID=403638 RepID=A0ABQ3XD60_9ACTN|nr:ABC transporter substrate-binding protein [Actinoplanes couchii]MDR6321344.1 polar amino acid transport system substrate-binding protein [Actinoplanes couchii]GID56454.1 putative amino acid ABC transporter, substrate-binding protein [Actinoplanes couchii]